VDRGLPGEVFRTGLCYFGCGAAPSEDVCGLGLPGPRNFDSFVVGVWFVAVGNLPSLAERFIPRPTIGSPRRFSPR